MTSVDCSVCSQVIVTEDDRVFCFGGCGQVLHVKCTNINSAGISAMQQNIALKYLCFDCRIKRTTLNDVQKLCIELVSKIDALTATVNGIEVKACSAAEVACKNVEERLASRIECIFGNETAAKILTDVVQPGISFASVTRSGNGANAKMNKRKACDVPSETSGSAVCDEGGLLRSGKRRRMAPQNRIETGEGSLPLTPRTPLSTEKRKNDTITKIEQTVLFKPKSTQPVENTKQDIRDKIDPIAFEVKDVQYRQNGEVAVRCASTELALKLNADASKLLAEKYEVEVMKPHRPRVKIVGVSSDVNEDELVEKIKLQNSFPESTELKIIRMLKKSNLDNNTVNVLLETDAATFNLLMKMQRVNVGWERCRVAEVVDVLRCFKCSEYGHKAASCKKPVCCPKCAEGHTVHDCDSDFAKCVNCYNLNVLRKLADDERLETDHCSWSTQCPLYQKQLKKAKLRIDYTA